MTVPAHLTILRDDAFSETACPGTDEPYFKLLHTLKSVPRPVLPEGFVLTSVGLEELADHINACYRREGVTAAELEAYTRRDVYDGDLWIAVRERETGRLAASGIGELDKRIGEGVLEWIQVSPAYRRRGLGKAVVCELLRRCSAKADFVTVSGRANNSDDPFDLYRSCGFTDPVIWHIITVE